MTSLKNFFSKNWTSVFSKTRNDFVFEHRNKDYGAYRLRKGYFKTLVWSYLAALCIIFLLVYSPAIYSYIEDMRNKNLLSEKDLAELMKSSDVVLSPPPDIQIDLVKPPAVPQIIIQKKDSVKVKAKEKIIPKDTITINQDSLLLVRKDSLAKDSIINKVAADALANDIINKNGSLQMRVDALPEFPGGELALNGYIKEHLKYSLRAKAMHTNGTVDVSFVVEADGSLTHIRLMMIAGNGLDDEVIALIKGMPKWKPGMRSCARIRKSLVVGSLMSPGTLSVVIWRRHSIFSAARRGRQARARIRFSRPTPSMPQL